MSDEEIDENEENYEIQRLQQEVETWKGKFKTMELKKREHEIALNKIKTEINSLRSVDKLWKEASKSVFLNLKDVYAMFNAQMDQIMDGLTAVKVAGERVSSKVAYMRLIKKIIAQMQTRIVQQEESIMSLNSRIRVLTIELDDKTKKVDRLSQGIEEEVERLTKPMRDKLADTMVLLMKEKAARAQERRELADLWPEDHLMPTILMKYRALTDEERERRVKYTIEQNASLALSLEVRANVIESTMWEIKYDDYGRPFYEHKKTGETSQEPPEIMSYKPPPGRDEMGNVIITEENDSNNWNILTDYKGQVYFKHKATNQVSYMPPFAYQHIPPSKTRDQIVCESAKFVIAYLKEKISKHIEIKKKRKQEMENPLTAEERKKKEKAERNRSAEEIAALGPELTEEGEPIDLSLYQYDIETVEMLANNADGDGDAANNKQNEDKEMDIIRAEKRAFLKENDVRKFKEDLYEDLTLKELDLNEVTIDQLRGMVESLASKEEHLEKKLDRTRTNLRDYSFLLSEKVKEQQSQQFDEYKEKRINDEKERQLQLKQSRIERLQKIQEAREQLAKEKEEHEQKLAQQAEEMEQQKLQDLEKKQKLQEEADFLANVAAKDGKFEDIQKLDDSLEEKEKLDAGSVASKGGETTVSKDEKSFASKSTVKSGASATHTRSIEDSTIREEDEEANEVVKEEEVKENTKVDAVLPYDKQDLALQKEAEALQLAMESEDDVINFPDEDLRKELFGDPTVILFGDLKIREDQYYDISESLMKLCTNLSNFAMFCGFNNLNMNNYPYDSNSNYSMMADQINLTADAAQSIVDDEWLSAHFFLTCSKQQIDQFQVVKTKVYDEKIGYLPIGPLHPEQISFVNRQGDSIIRHMDHSYTPLTRCIKDSYINEAYTKWKQKQLIHDIIKQQLQHEAIQQMYRRRYETWKNIYDQQQDIAGKLSKVVHSDSFGDPSSSLSADLFKVHHVTMIALRMTKMKLVFSTFSPHLWDHKYYMVFTVNSWSHATSGITPTAYNADWHEETVAEDIPINFLHLFDMKIQILDRHAHQPKDVLVGEGATSVVNLLGPCLDREVPFELMIKDYVDGKVLGTLTFDATASLYYQSAPQQPFPSSEDIAKTEDIRIKPVDIHHIKTCYGETKLIEDFESRGLRSLVNDLRGDNWKITDQFTGDFSQETLLKNSNPDIFTKSLKNLPDFDHANKFLRKKLSIATALVKQYEAMIAEHKGKLSDLLKFKNEHMERQLNEAKGKHKKLLEQSEDIKKDVQKQTKTVDDLKKPHIEPREPVFPEFPPIPLVPDLPASGGLDGRGKKKKALPAADLKKVMEDVENGACDAVEVWPLPENFFPSQAQAVKINKCIELRNEILRDKRAQEQSNRDKIYDMYLQERQRWEGMEKKRMYELQKAKKDCRKINVKYDCILQRINRFEQEIAGLMMDIKSIQELKVFHAKATDEFEMMKIKLTFEKQRQEEYIQNIKMRLLRAINARKFAYEFPKGAKTNKEYEEMTQASEEALAVITMEILECKELLYQEGVRWRYNLYEQEQLILNEYQRINISIEIISQRVAYDQILSRYKIEVIQVYLQMEKLKLKDADADDEGIETYEDLGERYLPNKSYQHNPDIAKCQRTIELMLEKIAITEGYGRSTAITQRQLIHTLIKQFYNTTFSSQVSWTFQLSDVERQQELQQFYRQELLKVKSLLQKQVITQHGHFLNVEKLHEMVKHKYKVCETAYINQYEHLKNLNVSILDEIRSILENQRNTSNEKIHTLEENIISLSRECQKIREELLNQQMVFDEKTKVLWAFIHTLQTSLQQLSARLEIVLEERERVVIESRLMADNARHQVRVERKHSANLLFIIHTQRGFMDYLRALLIKLMKQNQITAKIQKQEKLSLRKEVWDTVFTFTRICTDVDLLFDFFSSRLANLAGSRKEYNDILGKNNAAIVLAALCKNPKAVVRRNAARALSNMGWNGYVEKRILMWDCMMYWKIMKQKVISQEKEAFDYTLEKFTDTQKYESILLKPPKKEDVVEATNETSQQSTSRRSKKSFAHTASSEKKKSEDDDEEEFVPTGNVGLRSLIKQRKQWALRVARRKEGPHVQNQKLMNVESGVLLSLLELCLPDEFGNVDWEISRNAALAISFASYEKSNHYAMIHHDVCLTMILQMCQSSDREVQTHAAITIANLSFENEEAQVLFHKHKAIPIVIDMLTCPVADILEAASAALANLTSYSDKNCAEAFKCNGVQRLVNVILSGSSENLLDSDQNDEVHANCAEVLANISRFNTRDTIPYFTSQVLDALVIMCASANSQLRRHISLVIGNICQNERLRDEVGMKGGVEALFLILEDKDDSIQANALWALCNLMWHPPNQERAGRFMADLVQKLLSTNEPVVINANMLLGNVLYYNTNNRVRFLETDGALEIILENIKTAQAQMLHVKVVEGSLRSLLSLSYLDSIAMWLGTEGDCIPTFLSFLKPPYFSRECMRYSLEILCNLCLHHANRRLVHEYQGIDLIVPLHADQDEHIRNLSVDVIAHLEDITPTEVLARMRQEIGLERMVNLASSQDPLIRAVAAESIGEEIWQNPAKQGHAQEIGAIDALLAMLSNPSESIQSVLPALWSMRNLVNNNPNGQAQFGYRNGIGIVAQVIRMGLTGEYLEQTEKVFEAATACLIAAIQRDDRNARKLVMVGLDAILNISPESTYLQDAAIANFGHDETVHSWVKLGIRSEAVQTLVKGLLLMLAPYNYVVCKSCHKKQDLHGQSCYYCGHRLLVDVELPDDNANTMIKTTQSLRELPPWRPNGKLPPPTTSQSMDATNNPGATETNRTGILLAKSRSTPGTLEPLPNATLTTASVPGSPADGTSKRSYFSRTLPAKSKTDALPSMEYPVRPSSESKKHV